MFTIYLDVTSAQPLQNNQLYMYICIFSCLFTALAKMSGTMLNMLINFKM